MTASLDHMLAHFAPLPDTRAQWAPIQLCPLPHSGERITVAIAVRADDGDYHVRPTLSAQQARCMYGMDSASILGIVDLVCESLANQLPTTALPDWVPPVRDAIFMGPVCEGYGDSLAAIAHSGSMLASSLAVHVSQDTLEAAQTEEAAKVDSNEWLKRVRDDTLAQRVELAPHFKQPVKLSADAPAVQIGYMGRNIAVQFGSLIPGRGLSRYRNRAKASITDLQMLRDLDQASIMGKKQHYELMLWLPDKNAMQYDQQQLADATGAASEMVDFGDRHELRVVPLHASTAAAKRIIAAEQAA